MIEVSPYLLFDGDCEAAFNFYKSVFGGKFDFLYHYKDVASQVDKSNSEKIMHVSLPLMKNVHLMGMDTTSGKSVQMQNNVMIGLRLNDEAETLRIFNALSHGGKVIEPLKKSFYADLYGVLTDQFGIAWTFNCNVGRQAE
jgi:PhnB protein